MLRENGNHFQFNKENIHRIRFMRTNLATHLEQKQKQV